jgi:hypothetical protein
MINNVVKEIPDRDKQKTLVQSKLKWMNENGLVDFL